MQSLAGAREPLLDVAPKAFDGAAAKHDQAGAVVHQFLRWGYVIPPLQSMDAPAAEVRQGDRKAAASASWLCFGESEVVFECARQFDECHPVTSRDGDGTPRSYS